MPEYSIWKDMMQRVKRPDYVARGTQVCDDWKDSFLNFIADMGPRPSDQRSIDRIDNNGNYEPGNCRWATKREQALNCKTPEEPYSFEVEYQGETVCLSTLCSEMNLEYKLVKHRICSLGWDVERALTTPKRVRYKKEDPNDCPDDRSRHRRHSNLLANAR